MRGVPPRTVQDILGHQSAAMALRYAHLSPEHQLEAVRKLDSGRASARHNGGKEWRRVESNHGPRDYETLALTN